MKHSKDKFQTLIADALKQLNIIQTDINLFIPDVTVQYDGAINDWNSGKRIMEKYTDPSKPGHTTYAQAQNYEYLIDERFGAINYVMTQNVLFRTPDGVVFMGSGFPDPSYKPAYEKFIQDISELTDLYKPSVETYDLL